MWTNAKPETTFQDHSNFEENSRPPDLDEEFENDDYAIIHFPEAWAFLKKSHAYKWLLGIIKSRLVLTETRGTLMEQIGDEILRGLTLANRGRGNENGICRATFEVAWDLTEFINREFPHQDSLQIGSIITLTGSSVDAQALTCAEYMAQVWPTTGWETLKALQEAINKGIARLHKCKLAI
jgi:hypothetical protein